MMDTILNLGLNDTVVEGLAKFTNNPRFAYDSYRRFIQMFSDVVMELGKKRFEEIIDDVKEKKGVKQDVELDTEDMKNLVASSRSSTRRRRARTSPGSQGPAHGGRQGRVPLLGQPPRQRLPPHERDSPTTGAPPSTSSPWSSATWATTPAPAWPSPATPPPARRALFGEYLINAQGEDVVAGVRTPPHLQAA